MKHYRPGRPRLFNCERAAPSAVYSRETKLHGCPSASLETVVDFAGCVLVIAVLYWAQAVLVPIALAILITFVLTPPVSGWNGGSAPSLPFSRRSRGLHDPGSCRLGTGQALDNPPRTFLFNASTSCRKSPMCEARAREDRSRSCRRRSKRSRATLDKSEGPLELPHHPSWSPPRPPRVLELLWLGPAWARWESRARHGDGDIMLLERRDLRDRLIGLLDRTADVTTRRSTRQAHA